MPIIWMKTVYLIPQRYEPMKHTLAICMLCLLSCTAIAQQNLVPNGDFEYYHSCPNGLSQIDSCVGWGMWSLATSDYFNTCGSNRGKLPNIFFGYQQAASGNGFAGVYTHSSSTPYKEYITRSMGQMTVGEAYEVSLSVSLANTSLFGTNDMAVFFYDNAPSFHNITFGVPVSTPQVSWPGVIVSDTTHWVRLTKVFVADSAYDNIAIGGYLTLANADTTHVSGGSNRSYYYIDSVVVKKVSKFGVIFNGNDFCAGDTIKVPYFVSGNAGFATNNVFTLQLSGPNGMWNNPVDIGTKASNKTDTIIGVIPKSITTGAGYRLRLVSSNPSDISPDNPNDLRIGGGAPANLSAGSNTPLCDYDTVKLTAFSTSTAVSYSWTGPQGFTSFDQNTTISNLTAANTGDYILTGHVYGCSAKDTVAVVVDTPTAVTVQSNAPLCEGDKLELTATISGGSATYSWTGPNSFSSNQQNVALTGMTTAGSGEYIVVVDNGKCLSSDTVDVAVHIYPVGVSASSNAPFCAGNNLVFTGSATTTGVTYTWTGPNSFTGTGATTQINNANPVHNGDYYLIVDNNGCAVYDTTTVSIKPIPAGMTASANSPICAGEELNLASSSTTGSVTYSWTGPGAYSAAAQNPARTNTTTAMSGTYTATATLNGCTASSSVSVTVKPSPAAVSASTNSPVCQGSPLQLSIGSATSGVTYSWAGPNGYSSANQNNTISNPTPAASGQYIATVDLNGCTHKDTVSVVVGSMPSPPSVSYNNPICLGDTLKLQASGPAGSVYTWVGKNGFSSGVQNPERVNMQYADTGVYKVYLEVNGCTSPEDSVRVTLNPNPFVVIQVLPGDTICQGAPTAFTAFPNNHGGTPQYQWYINNQAATTGNIFSSSSLNDGDIVRCEMTEYTKCGVPYTDESNDVEMHVLPWLSPSVTITADPNRPLEEDEYVIFTATPVDAGALPEYQWKRNGNDIVGAKGKTWSANTLNDNDKISVEVISTYKCPQPATAMSNVVTVNVLTGVNSISGKGQDISLYPNPNNGRFVLEAPGLEVRGEVKVTVLNAVGQVVYSEPVNITREGLHHEIDIHDVAAGVYLLRLQAEEWTGAVRFTKQ